MTLNLRTHADSVGRGFLRMGKIVRARLPFLFGNKIAGCCRLAPKGPGPTPPMRG